MVQGDDREHQNNHSQNKAPSNKFLKLKETDIQEDINDSVDYAENADVVDSDLRSSPDRGGGNIIDSSMGGMT